MDYLWVGLGGFLGAIARFALSTLIAERFGVSFPWGTLLVNLTGSFLIGLIMAALLERSMADSFLRLLIVVGFLGGYTTFSSYTFEAVTLMERGAWTPAFAYMLGGNLLGLLATLGGIAVAKLGR